MNRTRTLLQAAERHCAAQDWQRADLLFQQALSESDNDPATCLAAGCHFAERQQFGLAIPPLMLAMDRAQAEGDLRLQAVVLRNLAAIYRELGELELARQFQRQTLSLQESVGADELLDWSVGALLAGKTWLAQQLAEQAGELAEDAGDIAAQAAAYGQQGLAAARRGQLRPAMRFLLRAARGHQYLNDDRSLGADYQNLAEVCGILGRLEWQRGFFVAAERCFQNAGMVISVTGCVRRQRETARLKNYQLMNAAWN